VAGKYFCSTDFKPMKVITDKPIADDLINRINALDANSRPQWGKMSVYQMLKHLALWEEMAMGTTLYKRVFIGRIFGKIALKDMLKDKPIKQNLPTVPGFAVTGDGDVAAEKLRLTELIKAHANYTGQGFLHPFFGELTPEQAGHIAYKHADHHLKQFGV
jgi:hypothetical protein